MTCQHFPHAKGFGYCPTCRANWGAYTAPCPEGHEGASWRTVQRAHAAGASVFDLTVDCLTCSLQRRSAA